MLRTTLTKIRKACSTLLLTPRVIKGNSYPGIFQKLSITVLRRADKSTHSRRDREAECEKCKQLIELIFGPSKPADSIQGITKTELPDAHINELQKDNFPELVRPQVLHGIARIQYPKEENVYTVALKDEVINKGVLENENPTENYTLNATTAKQTEEQLIQKIEIINETPVVETENPPIEGLNVSPKVLGNVSEVQSLHNSKSAFATVPENDYETKETVKTTPRRIEAIDRLEGARRREARRTKLLQSNEMGKSVMKRPIYSVRSDGENRKSGASAEASSYDDLAKRCLDVPNSQIDERLLKEMEKLGVPHSGPRGESSVIEENIIQMDVIKKPRKPVEKTEVDLEARKFEGDSPIAYIEKLYPAFQMAYSRKIISKDDTDNNLTLISERIQMCIYGKPLVCPDMLASNQQLTEMNLQENSIDFEPRPKFDPNQAIIDPYDKKNITHDNDDDEYDRLWYKKYSFHDETVQGNVEERPKEFVEEKSSAAQFLAVHKTVNVSEKSETIANPIEQAKDQQEPLDFPPVQSSAMVRAQFLTSDEIPLICGSSKALQGTKWNLFEEPESDFKTEEEYILNENASEAVQFSSHSEPGTTSESNPDDAKETIQISLEVGPEIVKTTKDVYAAESIQYITPTEAIKENTEPAPKTFQYSIPPEPTKPEASRIEQPDVTYLEKTFDKKSPSNEPTHNPNISTEQISHSFIQPQTMVNPLVDSQTSTPPDKIHEAMSTSCSSMPKLNTDEEISLSEMLRRARMRNKIEYCQAYDRQLEAATGKCGTKKPACPPPPPKCPPSPPKTCPPPPPPCPKPCKPACPPTCPPPSKSPCKFKRHYPGISIRNAITLMFHSETSVLSFSVQRSAVRNLIQFSGPSHAVLNREVSQMQGITMYLITYSQKIAASLSINFDAENLALARDYEPWVPIPSWPIPKKERKRPFVCPKEGCKLIPPPQLRPPCNENPCINFPKRSNSFSIAKLFSLSLGDGIVFDFIVDH